MNQLISFSQKIIDIDPNVSDSLDELVEYLLMHPAEIAHFKETYKDDLK